MPITASAKKALRQSQTRKSRNFARKLELKTAIKKFKKLTATDQKQAADFLKEVYKHLDKSAKVGVIKKNTASRLKSRLSKKLVAAK